MRKALGRLPVRARDAHGFTMIEILVVVFLVGLMAVVVVPRMQDAAGVEIGSQARKLSQLVRYLYAEAALRGRTLTLNVAFEKREAWVTFDDPETGDPVEVDSTVARRLKLPGTVRFERVILPGVGRVDTGVARIHFYPEGWVDAAIVHLADDYDWAYTIRIHPVHGRGEVIEGHDEGGIAG